MAKQEMKPKKFQHSWVAYGGKINTHAKCTKCGVIRTGSGYTREFNKNGEVTKESPDCIDNSEWFK